VRHIPRYLTTPEWRRLLRRLAADRSVLGQRDLALIATLVYCGLRVAEVATLRLDAVRLDAGWLRVVGKGNKTREVPIPDALALILRPYLAVTRSQVVATPGHPYVFVANEQGWEVRPGSHRRGPRRLGVPLRTRTVYPIVMIRAEALIGRRVHQHMLRHTYATTLRRSAIGSGPHGARPGSRSWPSPARRALGA
jgi:integrase/recombinase XerD